MKRSEQINELASALSKAQGEIKSAEKDKTNPHYKQPYATLESVWEACRASLSKNGLSVVQTPSTTDHGDVRITTLLMHSSGQWLEDELILVPGQKTPQAMGSAITYGRRYMLMAVAGVAPGDDDDDGNAASDQSKKETSHAPTVSRPVDIISGSAQTKPKSEAKGESTPDFAQTTGARKSGEGERAHISKLAETNGWSTADVIHILETRFKVQKVSDLFLPQYQELSAILSQKKSGGLNTIG